MSRGTGCTGLLQLSMRRGWVAADFKLAMFSAFGLPLPHPSELVLKLCLNNGHCGTNVSGVKTISIKTFSVIAANKLGG